MQVGQLRQVGADLVGVGHGARSCGAAVGGAGQRRTTNIEKQENNMKQQERP
jgi:hypothetical protein